MTKVVYELTKTFPRSEQFGLSSQLRRASVSIIANIAEGYRRRHRADYVRFLEIAFGSQAETEALLLLARELGYASEAQLSAATQLADRTGAVLFRLIESLTSGGQYVVKEDGSLLPATGYQDDQ